MYKTRHVAHTVCKKFFYRRVSSKKFVLGIETSCDDTGAALVDENGAVLGEGYESQMKIHLENGGIIPHIAVHFHEENINKVVLTALEKSKLTLKDVSAIAVTTKPGLRGSLLVGIEHAKKLAKSHSLPLIPIHHMEAHALTARLVHDAPFPFLCLLASGGHCQLALVQGLDDFLLLGNSHHNSPGEILDKIARRLKLQNLPECYDMSGGKAIDFMSAGGDCLAYEAPVVMTHCRDCNFSFSGFSSFATSTIEEEEEKYNVPADGVIPTVRDLCATILYGMARHLAHRIQRAFLFCEQRGLLSQRTLVFSGGVACSSYLRTVLRDTCSTEMEARFVAPTPKLCVDNGIMIAWNGMERLKENIGIYPPSADLKPQPGAPLGKDISGSVIEANIKVRIPKLLSTKKEKEELQLEI